MSRRELTDKQQQWQRNLKAVWLRKKDELNLTQEKLAEKIGWKTQGAVASYLNGRIPLNTNAKLKFAFGLEVDVTEIDPDWLHAAPLPDSAKEFIEQYGEQLKSLPIKELIKLLGKLEAIVDEHLSTETIKHS